MGSYYYLISGLPEVKLSDSKAKYDINEKKETKYSIVAKIPLFKKETETTKKVNQEIFNTFGGKIVDI